MLKEGRSRTFQPGATPLRHRFWLKSQGRIGLAIEYTVWNRRSVPSILLDLEPPKVLGWHKKVVNSSCLISNISLQNNNRYKQLYIFGFTKRRSTKAYHQNIIFIKLYQNVTFLIFKPPVTPPGHENHKFSKF